MTELYEKARAGDSGAFAELYRLYADKLYSTAFYLLGRKEDAEDVVMDTVADAFASIRKLRDPNAFGGWIFRILMNKLKRKRGSYINEPGELNEDIAKAAEGGLTDEQIAVRQALAGLDDVSREIVTLSVISGYRSEEIARIMGMNANTVRSRKQRALMKLRDELE